MKIDPYCQGQKCSPEIIVSGKIRLMWILGGVRWPAGFKGDWGLENWQFSLILPAISSEPPHLRP